jgi:pimeloyl-ACP methyl ester carboxylesterase
LSFFATVAPAALFAEKRRLRSGADMAAYTDGYWWSNDGLRLHYRDYAGGDPGRPPIICIPGLTRNARDFEGVANALAGAWRVICVDLRGRGESAYAKDPMTYVPLTYVQDLEALLRTLELERFVLFGTSLGGLLSMLLAAAERGRVQGALINDVGPVLDEAGMARIRAYVGRSGSWPTWVHAARDLSEVHKVSFPDWRLEEWLGFAKKVAKLSNSGRVVLDYDMRIAEPFRIAAPVAGMDMWGAWRALQGVPTLIVRGEVSDIVSPATVARMQAEHDEAELVTVPRTGHAPTLDEPEARAGIARLLGRVTERLAIA